MESHSIEELRKEIKTRDGRKILLLSGHGLHELPVAVMELTELEELYLTNNKLKTIPENVRKLINLTRLDLYGNQLSIFPTSLTQLKRLKWLDISYNERLTTDAIGEMEELEILYLKENQLTELSPSITQLKKLKELYMTGNKLTTIPDAIGEMVGLRVLELNYNRLTELSPALKQLKKLKELSISRNQLTTIPAAIGEIVDLEKLDLSHNQLTVLSSNIKWLRKLKWLKISYNKLTSIPNAIGEMLDLETLDLNHNQLSVLSPALKELKELKYLYVDGNPFTVEGMRSVMELKDKIDRAYSAIPDYVETLRPEEHEVELAYERALKDGYVKVYRGRIMLLGQERAGKTSLKKSLLGRPFDPKEQSTEGIEVDPSRCEIDVDQVRNWQPADKYTPVLLEHAKGLAENLLGNFLWRQGKDLEDSTRKEEEDSEDSAGEEDSEESSGEDSSDDEAEAEEDQGSENFHDSKENSPNEPEVQIDSSSPPDDIIKYLHQWLDYVKCTVDINREVVLSLDMWDFAGQHLYYASHPIFLSSRALYILVHNLSKPLDAPAEPWVRQGTFDVRLENSNNETNIENLLSWLATVHGVAQAPVTDDTDNDAQHKLPYLRPPVFIVGTHADKPVNDIAVMKKQIQKRISGKEYEKHVMRPLYCIDNTRSLSKQPDDEIKADNSCGDAIHLLQNRIMEVLRKEPYMGKKIPNRWFLFENVIEALVAKQIYHRNLQQLEHYARKECFIRDPDEFDSMISFYHGLGIIIKHRNTVVLKAQWLIELFKRLITIPHFDKVEPLYAKYWQELEGSGILSMELVDHVFSSFIRRGINKEDILGMMERFGLIAKFSVSQNNLKYFVPAQLKSSPDELLNLKPSSTDPCPLYLLFMHGFVPHGLFLQLVSRSIRWCSKTWAKHQPTLYQNLAWFIIGTDINDFVLTRETGFVKVILRQRSQSHRVLGQNSAELATLVREFLEETLQALQQELPYLRGLQYKLCVACPYCHRGTEEPLHACSDHIKTTCTHKDCFHLIDANEGQPTICNRNISDKVIAFCGLEKWFSQRSQESAPLSKVCTSQSPSPQENSLKQGTPTDTELEELAAQIGEEWIKLGRRLLKVKDAKLEDTDAILKDIKQRYRRLDERAYHMLKHWKQKKGSEATYQILNDALQDKLVQRKDLAEKFCYHQASIVKPTQIASIRPQDYIRGCHDRIIQELQQMQLNARKDKSRTDLSLGLRKIASDKGFRISDNQGSGNCMFYALSEQLEIIKGIKIPPGRLRQILVQYLRSNPKLPDGTDLFYFVHGHQTWTEYLTHMEKDGTWGDHVILCAAANYLETCICVVSSLRHSNDVIIAPYFPVDESKTLVLGHIHEVHYVSLLSAEGTAPYITVGHKEKRGIEEDSFPCRKGETSKKLKKD